MSASSDTTGTKSNDPGNNFVDSILLALGFFILFILGIRTVSSSEIWLHLSAGRFAAQQGAASVDPFSFALSPGTVWLQTNWLYDLFVYHVWRLGGSAAAIVAHALAVTGAFLFLLPVSRRYSSVLHQALALLLCAWLIAPLFNMRPLLFCLLFVGLYIHILSREKLSAPHIIALSVTQILWANMHASFVLGIMFAGVRTLEARNSASGNSPSTRASSLLGVTVLLAGMSLINPFGISLFNQAIDMIKHPDGGVFLEWISPFYRDFLPLPQTYLTTTSLVLIASVFIFHRDRLPVLLTTAAVLGAFLMVRSNHVLELCAVLAFPFLTMSLSCIEQLLKKSAPIFRAPAIKAVLHVAILVVMTGSVWIIITNRYYVYSGSASAFGLRINTDAFPVAAADMMSRRSDLPEKILNVAHDGGYLLWRLPKRKVFTDPRGNLYGGLFYDRLAKGLIGQDDYWEKLLSEYDPDALLISATWTGAGTMAYRLLQGDRWAMVYFDGSTMLIARTTSVNAGLLEDKEIRENGLTLISDGMKRYSSNLHNRFVRPPNPSRLIGAASVYQALGHFEKSLPILKMLTKACPRMAGAWVNCGIAEVQEKKFDDAISTLQHAVNILPDNALSWLWLGKAHELSGNTTEATVCQDRARMISRATADRFEKEHADTKFSD